MKNKPSLKKHRSWQGPIPDHMRCQYKQAALLMNRCPKEADWAIEHEEFGDDPPLACTGHLGRVFAEIVNEPGCGIDELTVIRRMKTYA